MCKAPRADQVTWLQRNAGRLYEAKPRPDVSMRAPRRVPPGPRRVDHRNGSPASGACVQTYQRTRASSRDLHLTR